MPDRDQEQDAPSLELPKLGWRRRRPRPEPPAAEPPTPEPEAEIEETRPIVVDEPVAVPTAEPEPAPEPKQKTPRERKPGGMLAAVATGLVVGLGIVGLTWAALRSCEVVQGTSSCGGVGYPMIALILAVMVALGWLLLKLLWVRDPASTSFIGVGLAIAIALLVLVDHLMDRSMVVVVPLLCAATFALAHWFSRTFVEPPRG